MDNIISDDDFRSAAQLSDMYDIPISNLYAWEKRKLIRKRPLFEGSGRRVFSHADVVRIMNYLKGDLIVGEEETEDAVENQETIAVYSKKPLDRKTSAHFRKEYGNCRFINEGDGTIDYIAREGLSMVASAICNKEITKLVVHHYMDIDILSFDVLMSFARAHGIVIFVTIPEDKTYELTEMDICENTIKYLNNK